MIGLLKLDLITTFITKVYDKILQK